MTYLKEQDFTVIAVRDMAKYLRDYAEHFGIMKHIRFQTRIPDWMQPGEAFVYQVTALSPGGAWWEIGPPGFAVVW